MHIRPLTSIVAVAFAVAALSGVAIAAAEKTPAPVVTVTMTKTGPTISGPRTWHPGAVRIAVRSRAADQETTLLHFRAGYSYAKFVADGRSARGHSAAARAAIQRVFANTVFDGGVDLFQGQSASFAATVRPGTYYLGEMTAQPQLTPIHVAGTPSTATAISSALLTETDSGYRLPATLPARGTIRVRNAGSRPHRLNFIPVKPGTTRAQLGAYLRKHGGAPENGPPPPFALNGPQLGTADLSGRRQMQFTYGLPAGTYALIDFDQNMANGRPEALEGLYAIATLR